MTTQTEALKLALDKKADNARELGLDYEPENTLHWYALNYRTAPTQNAQAMFEALEKFVEDAIKEALAQPEQEPVAVLFEDGSIVKYKDLEFVPEKSGQRVQMLYTTPPQHSAIARTAAEGKDTRSSAATLCRAWVGLTDEDVEMIVENKRAAHWEFVRQVESLLKEKNTNA